MKRQCKVMLTSGDARKIVVVRHADHVHLVIYQGTEKEPLTQAVLLAAERTALIRALSDP